MIGFPELLGWSIAMLGNPWILIGGFIVAKKSPTAGEFWVRLAAAMGICTAIQIGFDGMANDGPSRWGFFGWFVLVSLGTVWATLIFLAVRKFREMLNGPKDMAES